MELLKFIFRSIVRLIAIHIVVYTVAIFGPALIVVPFILIAKYPTADFTWLTVTLFWIMPISGAFYTNLTYHWLSVRRYRQINRTPKGWRDAHGGIWRTGAESVAIMFGALFASYVCEVLFVLAFHHVPVFGLTRELIGFVLMPFATFAPVILPCLFHWLRESNDGDFISRLNNDTAMRNQLRAASLYAKNLRRKEAH